MSVFKRFGATALAGAAVLMFTVSGASAATPIAGLYNTGVDASGNPTSESDHSADLHWQLNGGAAYTGGTNGLFPLNGPWLPDDTSSRWITPTDNAADSFDPSSDGFYSYTLDFNMAATGGAMFDAQFAADNAASEITLNGHTLLANAGGFASWTSFSADAADFKTGNNELKIVVRNFAQDGGNPSGLDVQFLSSNAGAVPEPATWLLLILGFGGLGTLLRSRRGVALAA